MANINTVETESIQVGLAGAPPLAGVDIWPSLDPTVPMGLQVTSPLSCNFNGITNQNGVYNGIGAHIITGIESLLGFKTGVGGQVNAEPQNTNACPLFTIAAASGQLHGPWTLNDSPILTLATDNDSDIKLKKNIEPLQGSLDKVLQLKGVSFEWNEEKITGLGYIREGKREFGFIAQDVENVLPDLVSDRESEDEITKTVRYKNLTAVLVEAIKEQQEQINQLKETVQELSTKLADCCS